MLTGVLATATASGKNLPQEKSCSASIEDEIRKYLLEDANSDEAELDQILGAIGAIIDCLLRLSVAIRNPAPHDHFKYRAGAGVVDYYEQWDVQHVQDKFPRLNPRISERLGKAISWRRQYFKYRKEHHNRLFGGLDSDAVEGDEKPTVASSLPDHLKEFTEGEKLVMHDLAALSDDQTETSHTSYAPSAVNSDQLRVPPMPMEHLNGPFICPFCRLMLSIDTRNAWKLSCRSDMSKAQGKCPFCLSFEIRTEEQYYSHIGGHLEQLALFALPRVGEEDEGVNDGLNEYRTARVAEVLSDSRTLEYYIAAAPTDPDYPDDYYTEGWAVLRQCALDGRHLRDFRYDPGVPQTTGEPDEQAKAELKQTLLDVYARRHQCQKIYLRQAAAQRWVECRNQILGASRPHGGNMAQLRSCDKQLQGELARITDEAIYTELRASDNSMGRWTAEDPSLQSVQRWIRRNVINSPE
ncbi:hypothetical protein DL769_001323 [Monosporascus sp. CRB-8-3]|nr:hypothetical protein DL769_001323 [Monosporascus sp. CRB-8-3]